MSSVSVYDDSTLNMYVINWVPMKSSSRVEWEKQITDYGMFNIPLKEESKRGNDTMWIEPDKHYGANKCVQNETIVWVW